MHHSEKIYQQDKCILNILGFDVGMEINQRPGLDGSSSDSDDGAVLNFARSRIGTINQQYLIAALEDREQNTGTEVLGLYQLCI